MTFFILYIAVSMWCNKQCNTLQLNYVQSL